MGRILLLEDDPCLLRLLAHLLSDYDVVETSSAEHAIQSFKDSNGAIRLLVADLTLPVCSGVIVALILRCEQPRLPVLLTSGYLVDRWDESAHADLSRLGRDNVKILQKPFYPEVLLNTVRELFEATE